MLSLFISLAIANFNLDADKERIKAMTGCFDVRFQFVETQVFDENYPIRSEPHNSGALEWVVVDYESEDEIHLQHLLITPVGIIKHWRQEWQFNADQHFDYLGDLRWVKRASPKGKWLQRVYQVDDSPRYECSAVWGDSSWACEAFSPLPRREFSARSDYNILNRFNTHRLIENGWLHEQANQKLAYSEGRTDWIANEIGINSYIDTDEQRCQPAIDWWSDNKRIWNLVQDVWKDIYATKTYLHLAPTRNGKPLWQSLFKLTEDYVNTSFNEDDFKKLVYQTIEDYFVQHEGTK